MSESTTGDVDAVIAELEQLPLRVIVERLCRLEATLTAGGAISTVLRAAALRKMIGRWREDQVAPTGRAPGLGTVSLTLPQQKVTVDDEEAFASWLVQRHPTEVDATITLRVPPALLPAILESIDRELLDDEITAQLDAQLPPAPDETEEDLALVALARALRDREVTVKPKPQFTKLLLEQAVTVVPAGVGPDGEPYAAAVFADDGAVVDGVKVIPGADPTVETGPQPTSISVRLEAEAKARAVAAASAQFAALVAGQPPVLAVDGSLAGGNLEPEEALAEPSYDDEPEADGIPDDAPAIEVLGLAAWRQMRKPQLQAECRRLELDDSGTVAELKGRLGDWAASTASVPS